MHNILRIGTGYWASRALMSAIELDVFTHLGSGAQDFSSLTEDLGLHPRGARDFLDALVALGLLTRDGDRYANARESRVFLDRTKPLFVGGSFAMAVPRLWPAWARLTDALRTGRPQFPGASESGDVFEGLYADPDLRDRFLQSMTGASTVTARQLGRAFPWRDHRTFVDLGPGQGVVPVQLARAHPHLRGTGFDLPAVRGPFESYVAEQGLAERLRFCSGDFFADPLPTADVLIMGHVLHDWDLDQKKDLIGRAYAALAEGGCLLVYEALIDDERQHSALGLLMSLNMLVDTHGGFNFTAADCVSWIAEAGFSSWRVEPLVPPDSLVVAVK
ncbi:methyltransferase [Jatrophihabitans sp.]|uniref:methyltransferase n=1 Tax=Jatrophihabitans sp. TaxID=1932789 RepID=UPI0030C68316|nr:O-methyltransferase family 2 [Jatrophihabitans sp.]